MAETDGMILNSTNFTQFVHTNKTEYCMHNWKN